MRINITQQAVDWLRWACNMVRDAVQWGRTGDGAALANASAVTNEEPSTLVVWQHALMPLARVHDGLELHSAHSNVTSNQMPHA